MGRNPRHQHLRPSHRNAGSFTPCIHTAVEPPISVPPEEYNRRRKTRHQLAASSMKARNELHKRRLIGGLKLCIKAAIVAFVIKWNGFHNEAGAENSTAISHGKSGGVQTNNYKKWMGHVQC